MNNNDGGELGAFMAGFVIGGLVGAAVALVLAPQSGARTRSQLTGKGLEIIDEGEQRYQDAVENVDSYARQATERASRFSHDVEEQARIILDAGRQGSSAANDNGSASTSADQG